MSGRENRRDGWRRYRRLRGCRIKEPLYRGADVSDEVLAPAFTFGLPLPPIGQSGLPVIFLPRFLLCFFYLPGKIVKHSGQLAAILSLNGCSLFEQVSIPTSEVLQCGLYRTTTQHTFITEPPIHVPGDPDQGRGSIIVKRNSQCLPLK